MLPAFGQRRPQAQNGKKGKPGRRRHSVTTKSRCYERLPCLPLRHQMSALRRCGKTQPAHLFVRPNAADPAEGPGDRRNANSLSLGKTRWSGLEFAMLRPVRSVQWWLDGKRPMPPNMLARRVKARVIIGLVKGIDRCKIAIVFFAR
jgi:hypothetical protein